LTSSNGSVVVSQDGNAKCVRVSIFFEDELERYDLAVYESDVVRCVLDCVDNVLGYLDDPVEELEKGNSSGCRSMAIKAE
jgi:hypothetical protein